MKRGFQIPIVSEIPGFLYRAASAVKKVVNGIHGINLYPADSAIGSFAASHSRGTKPPCWRGKVALEQDKQGKLPFKIMSFVQFVLSQCGFSSPA